MILQRQNSSLTHFTLLALLLILTTTSSPCTAAIGRGSANVGKILVPMDVSQTDHLKAYGIAYWALQQGHPVEWLLNYRGGSFLIDNHETIAREARIRAVSFQAISAAQATRIYADIESGNMNRMHLEKAPRIAVYTPRTNSPGTTPSHWRSRMRKFPIPPCGTKKSSAANSKTSTGYTCTTKISRDNTANFIAATATPSGTANNRPDSKPSPANWALQK